MIQALDVFRPPYQVALAVAYCWQTVTLVEWRRRFSSGKSYINDIGDALYRTVLIVCAKLFHSLEISSLKPNDLEILSIVLCIYVSNYLYIRDVNAWTKMQITILYW